MIKEGPIEKPESYCFTSLQAPGEALQDCE
jgi:hypothetical protein